MHKKITVSNLTTIKESLLRLEINLQKCLLVTKNNGIFFGTLTDGDIRRAILTGANIENKIKPYVRWSRSRHSNEKFG